MWEWQRWWQRYDIDIRYEHLWRVFAWVPPKRSPPLPHDARRQHQRQAPPGGGQRRLNWPVVTIAVPAGITKTRALGGCHPPSHCPIPQIIHQFCRPVCAGQFVPASWFV
jgi:hypothetical protein